MGFWDTILQIIPFVWLWDTVSQHLGYIKDLNDNVDSLMSETNELKRKRGEFEEDVKVAESIGKKKLRCVDSWFNDVDKIVPELDSIKLEFDRGTINPFSPHNFGKRVVEKIKDVKILQDQGVFNEVATSPRQPPIQEVPEQLQHQNTSEETLEKITQALFNEEISTVCVYGMGGIGKTTLMKAIYNKLIEIGGFDQVIWVTVSKDLNLQDIQEKIGNKLKVKFHGNDGIEEKRDRLYARLSNVRYMLILDDLWEAFPLDRVGIPQPNKQNRCKIAITTRLIGVSNAMEVESKIEVKTLSREEAWNLFCSKTENVILLPDIRPLAEKVVAECGGLPLAINTIGGSMRHKDKKELWEDALRALRSPEVPEVPGMKHAVFLPLKLSYDHLEDPKIQLCFLYCSLYPEYDEIFTRKMVRYWAFEEGLMDNVNSLDEALKKGHGILERLKDACLLEEGFDKKRCVRMHDLLRDLAIWITSPSSSSSSSFRATKFLVKAGQGLEQPPEKKMWEGMGRISLMGNKIRELQIMPNCPDLVSLFLGGNYQLLTIHDSFFQLMPKLQILDLSYTGIKSLPPSLSLLVNLRVLVASRCRNLQELPQLRDLKELQLLDISGTPIKNLPRGIESLAKLKWLDLSHTNVLSTIPCNTILGLTCLEELRLYGETQMISVDTWREIATLPSLTSLEIRLRLDTFTANDMKHPMWSRLSRFLVVFGFTGEKLYFFDPACNFERMVCICDCQGLPTQITSLIGDVENLLVKRCQGLESVSQIIGDSKSLKCVTFHEAQGMKCGINWREVKENNALDRLEELHLRDLPHLQKVFDGGPPKGFQQLRKIHINGCPKLTCIFSSGMIQHLHRLQVLHVLNCEGIEEIVAGDPLPDELLQRLAYLYLRSLPKLMRICRQQLVLTSMYHVRMVDCPELRRLPVLCSRIQAIHGYIRGGKEWWEGIEWEDEHSKSLYSTIYQSSNNIIVVP